MKRIVTVCAVLLAFAAGTVPATPFRLAGIGGHYMVPDAEFDALNLNPALLYRLDGLCLVADLGLGIGSLTYVERDFTGIHYTPPTNNTLTAKMFEFDSTATRIGMLSGGKAFSIGVLLEPNYAASNLFVTLDPNSTTNDSADAQFRMFVRKGAAYNGRLLMAFSSGTFALGLSGVFKSLPYEYRSEGWTNGVEDPSARDATRNTLLDFTGDLGMTFTDNDRWSFGLSGGYGFLSGLNSPSSHPLAPANYIYTNDSFYFADRHSGSSASLKFFSDTASGESGVMRFCGRFGMTSETFTAEAQPAAVGLGLTNSLDESASQVFSLGLSLGRSVFVPRGLLFWGLDVNCASSRVTTKQDDDITAPAFFPGQELTTENDAFGLAASLALGAEGNVTPRLTLRGSLQAQLARYSTSDISAKDLFLDPVTVQNEGHTTFTMLPQLGMTAGASVRLGAKSWFDVYTGLNFFGLDLYSDSYDKDRLVSVADPSKVNPVDTDVRVSFKLRLGLRFML
jgi:hypothetical protein